VSHASVPRASARGLTPRAWTKCFFHIRHETIIRAPQPLRPAREYIFSRYRGNDRDEFPTNAERRDVPPPSLSLSLSLSLSFSNLSRLARNRKNLRRSTFGSARTPIAEIHDTKRVMRLARKEASYSSGSAISLHSRSTVMIRNVRQR
jgi:hypothetical protein